MELEFKSPWGTTKVKICFQKKPFSVELLEYDEGFNQWMPFMTVTTNLPGYIPDKPNVALVKNYSENEGVDEFLFNNKLAFPTGKKYHYGYVDIPEYEFDLEELKKYEV